MGRVKESNSNGTHQEKQLTGSFMLHGSAQCIEQHSGSPLTCSTTVSQFNALLWRNTSAFAPPQ